MNVRGPTTIHGSRQIGTTTRPRGAGTGASHARVASSSHAGTPQPSASSNRRRSDARASSTVSIRVTHTATPAARSRRTSSSRFSSWFATTRSGRSASTAARSGFFVPRTRTTSRSPGWVHHCVAPTTASRRVAARASVIDGTRLTTRRASSGTSTSAPRSSRLTSPTRPHIAPRSAAGPPSEQHAARRRHDPATRRDRTRPPRRRPPRPRRSTPKPPCRSLRPAPSYRTGGHGARRVLSGGPRAHRSGAGPSRPGPPRSRRRAGPRRRRGTGRDGGRRSRRAR